MWMISKIISNCASKCISLLFPMSCFICKSNILPDNEAICTKCFTNFTKALDAPHPFITSLYSFKDPNIKKSIHAIKYFHRKDLIFSFAKGLRNEIQQRNIHTNFILIPIPMPTIRKYIRGYNHCDELAKEIAKSTTNTVKSNILTRNPNASTTRQVLTKSRKQRLENQRDTFRVQGDVLGLHILLIDDVTTTGATLSEARKQLLKHGASYVEAFTIAH